MSGLRLFDDAKPGQREEEKAIGHPADPLGADELRQPAIAVALGQIGRDACGHRQDYRILGRGCDVVLSDEIGNSSVVGEICPLEAEPPPAC